MFRSIGGFPGSFAILVFLACQSVAGTPDSHFPAVGWELERDVENPSYAVTQPSSTDLNIDSAVLSCEQGPSRRGIQLRLYLSGEGRLAAFGGGKDSRDDPTVDLVVDGVSHFAQLLFADAFVVVADTADGAMPLLSEPVLDFLQAGRRMELRFQLARTAPEQPAFDGIAVVDLQAGHGGAVAAVRLCVGALSAMKEIGDRLSGNPLLPINFH